MRAALYARFSSDLQDPRSIDDQLRDCRAAAERNGWHVVAVYTDAAVSGSTMNRQGLQDLLAGAADRRFDVVVAEALDRLSRNLADTERLREDLAFLDIRIHTLSEGNVEQYHTAFKGLMNAQFITELGNKLRRAQKGTAAQGLAAGGISYGYDLLRDQVDDRGEILRGRRRVNPTEAETICRIFREYVAGVSVYRIAEHLNREGVPAPGARSGRGDGKWRVSTIVGNRARANGILHNRLYIGELVYNRTRKVRDPKTRQRLNRVNPPSEWQVTKVPELRIVDDATWSAAQELKARAGNLPLHVKRRPKHLLSGLVACGICGGPYAVRDSSRLACSNARNKGTCANTISIKRELIEARILGQLRKLMSGPKALAIFVKEYHEAMRAAQAGAAGRERKATKELGDVRGKIARLVAAIEDGGETKTLAARIRELEGRQAQLEAELAIVDRAPVALQPNAHEIFARKLDDLEKGLAGDDVDRAQSAADMRGLIDRILLTPQAAAPGGLEIQVEGKLDGLLRFAAGERLAATHGPGALTNRPGTRGGIDGAQGADYPIPPPARLRFRA